MCSSDLSLLGSTITGGSSGLGGLMGTVGTIGNAATALNAMTGGKLFGTAQSSASQVDPFYPYRAQLGSLYSGYLQPGAAIPTAQLPGYTQYQTGVLQPAMQAAQRQAASTGQLYSGAEQAALQNIGQQGYSDFMKNYIDRKSTRLNSSH